MVDGHPLIIYLCSICNSGSSSVVVGMSSFEMHMGMCTDVLMLCILIFMLGISWS